MHRSGSYPHKRRERHTQRGQALVEYALGLVLVGMVASISLAVAGPAVGEVYCEAVQTLNASLGSNCSTGDGPTILFARYNPKHKELDLQAKAPKDCPEDLIVKGYGPMTRQGSSFVFKKTIGTSTPPTTVEIGHDDCGWSSTPVN